MVFTLSATAVTRTLAIIAAALVGFSLTLQIVRWTGDHHNILGLLDLFDLDREQNVPTLFSTILFLLVAALFFAHGALARAASIPAAGWLGLAALFAWLGIDEAWEVHERAIHPVRAMLPANAPAWTHFAWVIPGAALVATVSVIYLPFLLRLAPVTRRALVTAACVFLSGALGMELVDGAWAAAHGEENMVYSLLTTVEEGLELAGLVLAVRALLNEFATRRATLQLHVST